VVTSLADTFAWAQVTDLWAPDVVKLADGKFYHYYCACKGDSPVRRWVWRWRTRWKARTSTSRSCSSQATGARSGEDGVTIYDALTMPNVVDPNTFFDQQGKLWMIYGSYSGGIFILEMDTATGLQKPGQGYGKHLIGGNHSRIEGAYVLYSPQSKYYYMFTSFGGLDANGAYNMRVSRSLNPDGPYLDAKGNDMANVKSNPALPLFDDATIAPYGQKIMGNHQFALAAGETGTPLGYVSPGHNSAYYEPSTGQYFLIFHTRFPAGRTAPDPRARDVHQCRWLAGGGAVPLRAAQQERDHLVGRGDCGRCGGHVQDDQSRQGHFDHHQGFAGSGAGGEWHGVRIGQRHVEA
jgi:arabinan endo-1,5-alpha-L-arabinosidase